MCEKGKKSAGDTIREAASQTIREILNSPSTGIHFATVASEAASKAVADKFGTFGGHDAKSK